MSSPDSRPRAHEPVPRWLVPMVAVILTAIAAGIVLWTVQGHQNSGPAVPLAIVNLDDPVTQGTGSDAKTIAAGRQLAAGLSSPGQRRRDPAVVAAGRSGRRRDGTAGRHLLRGADHPEGLLRQHHLDIGKRPETGPAEAGQR